MMAMDIFVQPHERREAIDAYRDRLSPAQIQEIDDAPEEALVRISFGINQPGAVVLVIPEG